jgi:phenylacetaldehyde dehydrogenase
MKPSDREQLIWRIGGLIDERADEFAQLETLDNGKPVVVAKHGDAAWSADIFRYYAGWTSKIEGATTNVSMPFAHGPAEYHAYTLREPCAASRW